MPSSPFVLTKLIASLTLTAMITSNPIRPRQCSAFLFNKWSNFHRTPGFRSRKTHVPFLGVTKLDNARWHRPDSMIRYFSTDTTNNDSTTPAIENPRSFPIYYNDVYEVVLPPNHRFPMQKYRQVREIVQQKLSSQAANSNTTLPYSLLVSPLATTEEIITTHDPTYTSNFLTGNQTKAELRNVGFPWSPSAVDRALSSVGGTVAAARSTCERLRTVTKGQNEATCWSAHIAGGTHHAFHDRGEGFCIFSDIAVAANVVLQEFPDVVKRILILDLDVHQGNGNAVLFREDDRVSTFSLHCSANYFSPKERSDLDVELPPGCNDPTYLSTLGHWLKVLKKYRDKYDLVFFQAGVDVLEQDRLGRMSLSPEAVKRRNQMVFSFATETDKPLVITMGGGYPQKEEWGPILEAHADVYLGAYQYLNTVERQPIQVSDVRL